jgi:hypothetical protein
MFASVAVVLAVAGCGPSGAAFVASPGDYADYRRTRLAPTLEERIGAATTYLDRRADGAFAPRVRAWLKRADRVYFQAKKGSAAGLRAYLQALPKGAHRAEASRLLGIHEDRASQQDALGRLAGATETRLARAAGERETAQSAVFDWVRRFMKREVWQRRLADAPADLLVPWSLSLPAPACTALEQDAPGRRCVKIVELPYTLPSPGGPAQRQITLEIAVIEGQDGRMREVTLGGPNLFGRVEEAHSRKPVAAADASARMASVSRVVEAVREIFGVEVGSAADCKRAVVAPVVLDLGCAGLRVWLRAGASGDEDDTITITPLEAGAR